MRVGTKYFGAVPMSRETLLDELGRGELRWGERTWEQHDVLILVRPGEPYSVQGFWDERGKFVCWYVNLQEPLRWTPLGYDTRDNALDLIVGEDLASWTWKDEHELEMGVKMGLFSSEEAGTIRRHAEGALDLMKRGEIWWREWRGWKPDPSWPLPALPDGWDVVQR